VVIKTFASRVRKLGEMISCRVLSRNAVVKQMPSRPQRIEVTGFQSPDLTRIAPTQTTPSFYCVTIL